MNRCVNVVAKGCGFIYRPVTSYLCRTFNSSPLFVGRSKILRTCLHNNVGHTYICSIVSGCVPGACLCALQNGSLRGQDTQIRFEKLRAPHFP